MNVLMISTDREMLKDNTPVRARIAAYGENLGHINVIVFTKKAHGYQHDAQIGEHVRAYPTNSRSRWLYGLDTWRIARALTRFDVVTVQDPFETGLVGLFIARIHNVPLHAQVHTDFPSPAFAGLSYMNRVRVMLGSFVLHRARRIRVVSESIGKSIETHYQPRAPITVLPIFIDIEKFKNTRAGNLSERFAEYTKKLLVISRLEPEKNVALALRSFATAAPSDACLIIVGEGRERNKLEKLTVSLNVAPRVFFEGAQVPAPYYALADLVLVTSRYEGYGMAIIEALAAGKPVLSTDVGIAREAGAIVASEGKFGEALAEWFKSGEKFGELKSYPYGNSDEYVQAYCEDIAATV